MSLLSGKLYHPVTNNSIIIYTGFSWPNLFFGIFWFFYKGMYLWVFLSLIISWYTSGLSGLILPFFVNDLHQKHLLGKGYQLSNDLDEIKSSLKDLKEQVKENIHKDEAVIETITSEDVEENENIKG